MILGARYWNDRSRFYAQENNPSEELLRKRTGKWLETCGPTAAVNCLAALGHDVSIRCPGAYAPQPEEVLMDFFNDPRMYKHLKPIRPETDPAIWLGNEIPQFYPFAVEQVFAAQGRYLADVSWRMIVDFISSGQAVQICLKNPGHYLAALAFDEDSYELIYNDPWSARVAGKDGFNERMARPEWEANVKSFAVVYTAP